MERDVDHYITNVCSCLKRRRPNKPTWAPLDNIVTTYLFEVVSTDYHLDSARKAAKGDMGISWLLLTILHTSHRRTHAPTSQQKRKQKRSLGLFVLRFGFPARLHHDQGKEFKNKLFFKLDDYCGIQCFCTTPYHRAWNGQAERLNQMLLSMLRYLTEEAKSDWKSSLAKVMHACNCTYNSYYATGYAPHYLL